MIPLTAGRNAERGSYYDVGYGKPPKSTRFQRGQSGNPSGRSKARASYAALTRLELDKKITLGRGDKSATMTKRQVIAARLRKAMRGSSMPRAPFSVSIKEKIPANSSYNCLPQQLESTSR
jgi:hypothetical protein